MPARKKHRADLISSLIESSYNNIYTVVTTYDAVSIVMDLFF